MSGALSVAMTAMWAVTAVVLAWYLASVASEVTYVTLADGRRQERSIPLLFRVLLPLAPNFFALARRPVFRQTVASADAMLVQGGFDGLLSGEEFVALKFMLLWVVPDMWLRRAVKRRHLQIQRSLPFVLDLLTLSVEAGMDFINAWQRNCRPQRLDPLGEELLRMTREIQVGASRKEALRRMADRADLTAPQVRALAERDAAEGSLYCRTLYTYLICHHSLQETCERLYAHRNTVLYRVRRMKEDFGIPLDDPDRHLPLLLSAALALLAAGEDALFLPKLNVEE